MGIKHSFDELEFQEFFLFDETGIFTDSRVDKETVPEGLYQYELRDEMDGTVNELADSIVVNFFGTCFFKKRIEDFVPENKTEKDEINGKIRTSVNIDYDDYGFGEEISVSEFI